MWVPDEGRLTGTPSLPTYGVPSLTPAFDATIYEFPLSRMTTGRMTCAFGADDVSTSPFRKLRFQMIDNRKRKPSLSPTCSWTIATSPPFDAVRTELAVPMLTRGRLVGVIDVQSTRLGAYQEEDRSMRLIPPPQRTAQLPGEYPPKIPTMQMCNPGTLASTNRLTGF